ncbi:MAG: esterase [SAR202 cluster bacterium Io17-Chloro-G9]|nr:MAG: esterase [SAR202 cluster bacterium Io17-Chloro-G9]
MALDSSTIRLLEQLAEGRAKPLHECTPGEARAMGAKLAELGGPAPAMQRVEERTIEGPDGQAQLRILVPIQSPRGVLVYYHGGGWVIGSIDDYDTVARKLAERTSCAVVLVGYRRAPEHRYPAAVDDSYEALKWVARHLSDIAGQEVPLMVAGDSAGGNLAAVMAIRARDRSGPSIALQVLIYPVTDADFDRPSYANPENEPLLTREGMIWFWDHYLPDSSRRTEPDASPLRTENLAGLPPASILTAEHDVLRDEGEAYAARLREANVPTDLQRYAGQMHAFFTLLMLPGSELGFQQVVKAVKACIAGTRKAQTAR